MASDEPGLRPPYLILALCAVLVVTVTTTSIFDFGSHSGSTTTEERNVASETRTLADAHGLEIAGPINTVIRIGSPQMIEVEAADTLRPRITTELRDGVVRIAFDGKLPNKARLKARVTLPRIETLHLTSSGNAEIRGLENGPFAIIVEGSGDVEASGTVDRTDVTVRGSGDVDLSSLQTRDPTVRVQGSGNVELGHVTSGTAHVEVRGSGNVTLSGRADRLDATVAGSGDIDASELEVQNGRIEIRGDGDVEVHVHTLLEVTRSSGSGGVINTGAGRTVTTDLGKAR